MQGGDAQIDEAAAPCEHAVVDVTQLEQSMREKLDDVADRRRQPWGRATICRVIPLIRQKDNPAFDPHVISIGPFHKDKEGLRAMEKVKWRYLQDLLARRPGTNLHDFIARVNAQLKDVRDQYSEELEEIKDDDFVKMMVLDGCFILELMFKLDGNGMDPELSSLPGGIWTFPSLLKDLLLFENQIPFCVLETLYEAVKGERPDTLPELARRTIILDHPPPSPPELETLPPQIFHLLHLYHHSQLFLFCPRKTAESGLSRWQMIICRGLRTINRKISDAVSQVCFRLSCLIVSPLICSTLDCCSSKPIPVPWLIPNATKLKEAGVRFKPKKFTEGEPLSLLKVTFSDDGTFEIPVVVVDGGFRSRLRNLIAFEQCCRHLPHVGVYFTSYCGLMSCLVDTESDVAILEDNRIFFAVGGRPDRAAALFDEAAAGATLRHRDAYFHVLLEDVNRYCKSALPRWRARLMHDYFGNPWTIISVIAAAVLLALTIVQTFYAPYAYYHPR